jgi:hypothetical protein
MTDTGDMLLWVRGDMTDTGDILLWVRGDMTDTGDMLLWVRGDTTHWRSAAVSEGRHDRHSSLLSVAVWRSAVPNII